MTEKDKKKQIKDIEKKIKAVEGRWIRNSA